jgi:hypothetical protein
MKLRIGSRRLMAGAAGTRRRVNRCPGGVRVVASDAGAGNTVLRMIGMDALVTTGASLVGRPPYVVGRMARRTPSMLSYARRGEHANVLVTRAAFDRLFLLELVGAVAADALVVPLRKQSARRYLRIVGGVALTACAERFGRRGVLMSMARRAHLRARLLMRGVRRRDVVVTVHAGRGGQATVLVGSMAFHAIARAVNGHGRRIALSRCVTPTAIRSGGSMRRSSDSGVVTGAFERECVASRAIGLRLWPKTRASLFAGVLDARFLGVASGAFPWGYAADRVLREVVTLGARNFFVDDVLLVAAHTASRLPGRFDVNALARRSTVAGRMPLAVAGGDCGNRHRENQNDRREVGVRRARSTALHGDNPSASSRVTDLPIEGELAPAVCCQTWRLRGSKS